MRTSRRVCHHELPGIMLAMLTGALAVVPDAQAQQKKPASVATTAGKPNILVIWGDDIGWYNPSIYNRGDMGYWTPNIDRIAKEGMISTDYYAEQSCTAARSDS